MPDMHTTLLDMTGAGEDGTAPVSAVRDGDWKLIELLDERRVELYHLGEDLGESKDLSLSRLDKSDELRRTLRARRESVGAQMPTPTAEWSGR